MKVIKLTKKRDMFSLWVVFPCASFAFENKDADPDQGARIYYEGLIWEVVETAAQIEAMIGG